MSFFTQTATVAVTDYPALPQLVGTAGGRWTFANVGAIRVLVSFDGTTDHLSVVANTIVDSLSPATPPRVWLKLAAAGSCDVTGNLVTRDSLGNV